MRLVLNSLLPDQPLVKREFGRNLVIDLDFVEALRAPSPYYWRLVDDRYNLVEIAIDPSTGALRSFSLVFYRGEVRFQEEFVVVSSKPPVEGLPAFSTNLWQIHDYGDYDHEVTGQCRLHLVNDRLYLILFDEEPTIHVVTGGACEFLFNRESELVAVALLALNEDEIKRVIADSSG